MGRSPCCEKVGLKKGPWTPEEDQKLLAYIEKHGNGSWRALPAKAGEPAEVSSSSWSAIATHLPKRTDNEIKNYWNTHLKKRLAKMGIDPCTHKAKSDTLSSGDGHLKSVANLSHIAHWESARLEAEERLARESKFRPAPNSMILQQQQQHMGSSSSSSSTVPPPPAPLTTKAGGLDVLRAWAPRRQDRPGVSHFHLELRRQPASGLWTPAPAPHPPPAIKEA
ncbi:hypothetical protein BHM03_00026555 [Ensete ventricosum]|nr:hypothetical protein BHM03_00026555 [Ensete ventricosum]